MPPLMVERVAGDRIALVQDHIVRILSEFRSVPLSRYELINQIPCGFTYAEALRALDELEKAHQIRIVPHSSGPDFSVVQLKEAA